MTCKRCAADMLKDFNGEVGIRFPGLEGLDQPTVLVYPKLIVCLGCGVVQFVLPDEQLEQLKNGGFTAQSQHLQLSCLKPV
jgi:hypothetical protein